MKVNLCSFQSPPHTFQLLILASPFHSFSCIPYSFLQWLLCTHYHGTKRSKQCFFHMACHNWRMVLIVLGWTGLEDGQIIIENIKFGIVFLSCQWCSVQQSLVLQSQTRCTEEINRSLSRRMWTYLERLQGGAATAKGSKSGLITG